MQREIISENKSQSTEKIKSYLYRACQSKGVSYYHLHFSRDSKASRGVGNAILENQETVFGVLWLEVVGIGRLEVS